MIRTRRHRLGAALAVTTACLVLGATTAPGAGGAVRAAKITDATGHTVRVDGSATRVVALEWVIAEDLVVLGVTPVGVADISGYRAAVSAPAIPKRVRDVGTRQQPSLERIAALRPDLIVGVSNRIGGSRKDLERIAPTLVFDPYPAQGDRVQEMRSTLQTLARATGTKPRATAALAELDATIAKARTALTTAGLAGAAVAVAHAGTSEGQIGARIFTQHSMVMELVQAIGLRAAWAGSDAEFGFDLADLEAFALLPADTRFVYVPQSETDDVVRRQFAGNALWENLPFVRAGHVSRLAANTWLYGGPRSAEVLVDRVVTALVR